MDRNVFSGVLFGVGATALVLPGAAAAEMSLYGRFNVALDNQKDEIGVDFGSDERSWKFRDANNSSRIGVKGAQALGVYDLDVFYKMEWGVDPDGSEGNAFSERDIYIGVRGGFGAVQFGKYDTPFKHAGAYVDQFNDTPGDITKLLAGENRVSNLMQYTSPTLAEAFEVVVAVQPGEGRTATDDVNDTEDGLADTMYAVLNYNVGDFRASAAYVSNQASGLQYDGDTAGVDILRLTGLYRLGDLELGALYQSADGVDQRGSIDNANGGDAQEVSLVLSAGYTINLVKLKAQYGQTDGDASDLKRTELALGAEYKLSKSALVQVYYVDLAQDVAGGGSDLSTETFGTAFIYNF